MEAKGPYCESCTSQRAWGMTTVSFPAKASCSSLTNTYATLSVSLDYVITMPCWYPQSGTKPDQIAEFDKFMQYLAAHELRHVVIGHQYVEIIEQQLRSNICSEATFHSIYDQVLSQEEAAQEAFHGSPEGQSIPWP
jgi:predicted secreted Zn-dependent protease